jgi:DNA-binding transcriptional regulator YdaS (Cro superfamily)
MKLRDYLKRNGIKSCWFAEQVPCSPATLNQIALERRSPTDLMILRLSQLTNGQVTKDDFAPKKPKTRRKKADL